jgi:hypothetical protein
MERIKNKMLRSSSVREGNTKRGCVGAVGRGNRSIDGIYTPAFRARAGLTKMSLFFYY